MQILKMCGLATYGTYMQNFKIYVTCTKLRNYHAHLKNSCSFYAIVFLVCGAYMGQ